MRTIRAGIVVFALACAGLVAGASSAVAATPVRDTVSTAGTAGNYGSTGNTLLNKSIVDLAPTATGGGYWLLAGDGGVFAYGNAPFYGSTGNLRLNSPAWRMAPTRTGGGYWFVAADGGTFAFGDAPFFGSMGGQRLNKPVIGIIPTSTGRGYWLVAEDGGVFAFGDAGFRGSLGGIRISAPIVALAPTITNNGYWLLGRDGAIYSFGDAAFLGGQSFVAPIATDIAALPDGSGYVILDETGGVWAHRTAQGNATGAAVAVPRGNPHAGSRAIAIALSADGNGTWIAWSGRARVDEFQTAFGPFHTIRGVDWSRCQGFQWRFDPRNAPPGALGLYEELFDYASRVLGVPFNYAGTIGDEVPPSNTIVAGWQDLSTVSTPDAGIVLGATQPVPPNRAWMWLASNDTLLLPPVGSFYDWTPPGWGQVAIHELGHALGLDHIDDPASIMNPSSNILLHWGQGDLAGIRGTTAC